MDYAGNANKDKETAAAPEQKKKNIEKVVTGDVVVQKKSIGRKFRDVIVEADFRSVMTYVFADKVIPAVKNMVVDAITGGTERMIYGERAVRPRHLGQGPRITYNNPINRQYRDPRMAPPREIGPRRSSRQAQNDIILSSRDEAELVLERLNDVIESYEVASIADLNELIGIPVSHVDHKWGWVFLADVQIRQLRDGYLLDLPPAEPIH